MSTTVFYHPRPIKRPRRTNAALRDLKASLYTLVAFSQPMTVRQIFYQAVTAGLIDKTEQEYKNTIVRLLGLMRKAGELPYGWIADNTRWMRKPRTHGSLEEALLETAAFYRRNIWHQQPAYVEIWLEKDALSGVLSDVTYQWDVPLMVTRGYSSLTFLAEAAEAIRAQDKPIFIYYFGDWDPSGSDIPRCVEKTLRDLSGGAEITFTRQAVNPEQIVRFNLPTRPTKASDSRSKTFTGESVEVDALPPDQLRQIVEACIVRHVDQRQLAITKIAEKSERTLLQSFDIQTLRAAHPCTHPSWHEDEGIRICLRCGEEVSP